MQVSDGEGQHSKSKDEEEDLDLPDGLDDDGDEVAYALDNAQLEQLVVVSSSYKRLSLRC